MKLSRLLPLLACAIALPAGAFAAKGVAEVTALSGLARAGVGEATPASIEVGAKLEEGSTIETGSESGLEVTLPNGKKLILAPNTRIRIRFLEQSAKPGVYSYEVALLRGGIRVDATNSAPGSNFLIVTSAGSVNIAGSVSSVDFSPTSVTAGNMYVVTSKGSAVVFNPNSIAPVSVPAGSQTQIGQGAAGAGQVTSAAPEVLTALNNIVAGGNLEVVAKPGAKKPGSTAPATTPSGVTLPDFSIIVVSPNGEGQNI